MVMCAKQRARSWGYNRIGTGPCDQEFTGHQTEESREFVQINGVHAHHST